jgi:CBS domain-containing protein
VSVAEYCRRDPQCASASESVRAAARRMDAAGVGCLVVVDERRRPRGVLTDRDVALAVLCRGVDPDATTAGELLEGDVVSVTARAPLAVAIRMLRLHAIRRLPVVDARSGELVGIFTADDVMQLVAAELGAVAEVARQQFPADLRGERALGAGSEE